MKKFIKIILIISILIALWFLFFKPLYYKVFKIRDLGQSTEIMTIKDTYMIGEGVKASYENYFTPHVTPTGFEAILVGKYGDEFRVPITSDTYSTFILNKGKKIEVVIETAKSDGYFTKIIGLNKIINKEDSMMDIVNEFQN